MPEFQIESLKTASVLTKWTSWRPGRPSRVALVCANFGGIDDIKPLVANLRIDGFYYTDRTTADAYGPSARGWARILVPDYPRHDFNARLRGRYFKAQIYRLPEVEAYDWLAWTDANVLFHDTTFLTKAADRLARRPGREQLLLIPHPHRETVQQEYTFISDEIAKGSDYLQIRYAAEKMPEQMAFFESRGWNLDAPLWCGTVWLIRNSPRLHRCWDDWWDQTLRYGLMDQLSLPIMLAHHGLHPQAADFRLDRNPHFTWGAHAKHC